MAEATIPLSPPPDRAPRAPHFKVPAGAVDSHVHVFSEPFGYQPNRAYTPSLATPDDLDALMAALGIDRAVVVQASVHGRDNAAVVDALQRAPERLRGVCALDEEAEDGEIEALHAAGVRGIRVNLVDKGGMPFRSLDALAAMSERIADLGWHIELLVHVEEAIEDLRTLTRQVKVPMSVGHLGYTKSTTGGADHPGYRAFLDLMRDGHFWVKLSGPYRISTEAHPPYADVRAMAAALVEAAPDRLVWGSDWPHVMQWHTMPNDGDLLDLLADWAPDEALRRRILVDNPARLYGFPPVA